MDDKAECARLRRKVADLEREVERLSLQVLELQENQAHATVPVECEEIVVRPNVGKKTAAAEITQFVAANPGSDVIDIANGLRLDLGLVEGIVEQLAQKGVLIGEGE